MRSLVLGIVLPLTLPAAAAAQLGSFTTSGAGCPASLPPTLSLSPTPNIGTLVTLTMHDAPADTLAASALVGLNATSLSLDMLGATGCTLYSQSLFSFSMSFGGSTATTNIQLPIEPSSIGRANAIQGAALAPSANPFGLAMSELGTLTIGSPATSFLRAESCAPVTSCTFGGATMAARVDGASYEQTASVVTSTGFALLALQGIGAPPPGADFTDAAFRVDVWVADTGSVFDAFGAAGSTGNFASVPMQDVAISTLSSGDRLVETGPRFGIVLPPGTYLVALSATSPGLAGWSWRENASSLAPSDVLARSAAPGTVTTYDTDLLYASGAQAVDLIGY